MNNKSTEANVQLEAHRKARLKMQFAKIEKALTEDRRPKRIFIVHDTDADGWHGRRRLLCFTKLAARKRTKLCPL